MAEASQGADREVAIEASLGACSLGGSREMHSMLKGALRKAGSEGFMLKKDPPESSDSGREEEASSQGSARTLLPHCTQETDRSSESEPAQTQGAGSSQSVKLHAAASGSQAMPRSDTEAAEELRRDVTESASACNYCASEQLQESWRYHFGSAALFLQ